jgi:hypothetical protein
MEQDYLYGAHEEIKSLERKFGRRYSDKNP